MREQQECLICMEPDVQVVSSLDTDQDSMLLIKCVGKSLGEAGDHAHDQKCAHRKCLDRWAMNSSIDKPMCPCGCGRELETCFPKPGTDCTYTEEYPFAHPGLIFFLLWFLPSTIAWLTIAVWGPEKDQDDNPCVQSAGDARTIQSLTAGVVWQ